MSITSNVIQNMLLYYPISYGLFATIDYLSSYFGAHYLNKIVGYVYLLASLIFIIIYGYIYYEFKKCTDYGYNHDSKIKQYVILISVLLLVIVFILRLLFGDNSCGIPTDKKSDLYDQCDVPKSIYDMIESNPSILANVEIFLQLFYLYYMIYYQSECNCNDAVVDFFNVRTGLVVTVLLLIFRLNRFYLTNKCTYNILK